MENARTDTEDGSSGSHRKKRAASHNLQALSRKRDDRMRDFFYKTAWLVCRKCMERKIDVIVIGHNKDQKQEIGIGRVNSQNFVSVPFTQFITCLKNVACACGIPVVEREERYTSKADIFKLDDIPTYGEAGAESAVFTGVRKQRGLYCTDDGQKVNADINGSCNILRKEYPYAFDGVDMAYLTETTEVYTSEQILGIKYRENGKSHFKIRIE